MTSLWRYSKAPRANIKSEWFESSTCYSVPHYKTTKLLPSSQWSISYSGPHYNEDVIVPHRIIVSLVIVRPTITDPTARKQSQHRYSGAHYNKAIIR